MFKAGSGRGRVMLVKFKRAYDCVGIDATGRIILDNAAQRAGCIAVHLAEPNPQYGYYGNTVWIDYHDVGSYLEPIGSGARRVIAAAAIRGGAQYDDLEGRVNVE